LRKKDLIIPELEKGKPDGYSNNDWFRAIAAKLLKDGVETTYKSVSTVYDRNFRDGIKIDTDGKESWQVLNGNYYWESTNGVINIPVDEIDILFWKYSSHGLDLGALQVRVDHNLKPWEWNSIKTRLSLFKTSNIFSPHTWETTPPEERDEMVRVKMAEKFNHEGQTVKRQYDKELNKRYKDAIASSAKAKFFSDELQSELLEILPSIEGVKLSVTVDFERGKNIVVTISDLHIGAEVDGLRATKDYNNEILLDYLDKTLKIVNSYGAERVTLVILGDLIESFTGTNHANSWKSLAKHGYGSKVVIRTYEILLKFISKINNIERIIGIGGNHDRPTASKNDEANGEIAELIFYMLGQSLKGIEICYDHSVLSKVIYGIQYIMVHGDKGHSKKTKIPNLLFNFGNKDFFNLILAGHLHSRIVSLDSVNARMLNCASMFTGNQYSDDLGFSSTAGFNVIENLNGLPKITDYTL